MAPEDRSRFFNAAAILFDLDGVLTPTADLHMHAWATMFSRLFEDIGVTEPYTDDDYYRFLDGRTRYEGVEALLGSRSIAVPYGAPTDPPAARTVCGLGNRKNEVFNELLEREGIAPYPGSLAVVDRLGQLGIPAAVVSSSKNARPVLAAAHLLDRFPVIVDGIVAADEHLPSKPKPDIFLTAARLLGVEPRHAVVVEDAISGVEAGRAGRFAYVIGVDRGVGPEALTAAGADAVVRDLAELLPDPDSKDAA